MTDIPENILLLVAALLFCLGLVGVVTRRNFLFVLICLEIMINAAGLVFIIAGSRWHQADGQIFYIFTITMAAAEVAVGLALALLQSSRLQTLDTDAASRMQG